MNRHYSLISLSTLIFCCASLPVLAGEPDDIALCFDENGDITYSDVLCATFENNNPLLMSEDAVQRHIRNNETISKEAGTIASAQLSSVTTEAIDRCQQNFSRYFKRKYRSASYVPSIAFDQLVDQYNKGSRVSISAVGSVEYEDNAASRMLNIECTAQKLGADANWQVGYREK
ncbi:MAG: hypothetical protein AMJ55_06005 [Gammaproteobacteria bacterium SG8_15]|nr:MAG: hypothetical protein AMJ55_06005 [Gammaproteobacteria bacterium SG8_15]